MRITVLGHAPASLAVDLLIIPVHKGVKRLTGAAAAVDKAMGGLLADLIVQDRFEGKEGERTAVRSMGKIAATKVMLLGAGDKPFSVASARKLAALATGAARGKHAKTVAFMLPDGLGAPLADVTEAVTEGAFLGDYRFLKYKDEELRKYAEEAIDSFGIVTAGGKKDVVAAEKGIRLGHLCSHATILARGLVNEPASEMTPGRLADVARALAAANPKRLALTVHGEKDLKEMGAGGILAVAKGSDEPPYLVHLTYRPAKKAKKRVVLIGKGITFDSGGLSLKPSEAMEDMKIDMAGCAAMLGVMSALPELAPDVEVHGISAICENMPSGKATRPGDIVRTMQGKTIEILNTDAEGRVTLADALHYGAQLKPDYMVDLATLTGACMVALGQEVAGVMSNDRKLAKRLLDAAANEGELLWELPLVDEYRKSMKSHQADLKNISGTRYGGAITAGLFLEEFVGKTPWAHLDIAGPAWAERDTVPHQPRGATGFGVRIMIEFIEKLSR
ncbi:MAG TPA: leucyl aminopeptidase [Patescibacteria group bacterium]|nr:leucyl aminopeptidase [Patescibacteria group bacterium]